MRQEQYEKDKVDQERTGCDRGVQYGSGEDRVNQVGGGVSGAGHIR